MDTNLAWLKSAISEIACASVSKRVPMQNPSRENEFDLPENEAVGGARLYECFARRLVLTQSQKALGSSLLLYILSSRLLGNFEHIFSCIVSFLFQRKGSSGDKAIEDDKGASNSSADYENHSSVNCAEQQIDSFDELNLEEKQESHRS